MKRTAFKRAAPPPRPVKTYEVHTPRQRLVAVPAVASNAPVFNPQPKQTYVRSQALREAYRLIPCQFTNTDGTLCGRPDTCCCHANAGIFGKGKGIKACDTRAAAGCQDHHHELDQDKAWSRDTRRAQFWAAHVRSVNLMHSLGHWPAGIALPDLTNNPFEIAT